MKKISLLSMTTLTISAVIVLPSSPVHANGASCSISPSPAEISINREFFDINFSSTSSILGDVSSLGDLSILNSPSVLGGVSTLAIEPFYPPDVDFTASGNSGIDLMVFTMTVGGTTYSTSVISTSFSFSTTSIPAIYLWIFGFIFSIVYLTDPTTGDPNFLDDFPNFENLETALGNPQNYPFSWEFNFRNSSNPETTLCSLGAIFRVTDGVFDWGLPASFRNQTPESDPTIAGDETTLPNTV